MVFAGGFAKTIGNIPLLFDTVGPSVPFDAIKSIELEESLDGNQVQEQSADAVSVVIEEKIEVRLCETFC